MVTMNTRHDRRHQRRSGRTIASVLTLVTALLLALSVNSGSAFASPDRTGSTVIPLNHLAGNFTGYEIIDYATGRCLDSNVDTGPGLGGNTGSVYTLPCNGGKYQRWDGLYDPQYPRGGSYLLVDEQTTFCLYITQQLVITDHCADQDTEPGAMDMHLTFGGTPAYQIKGDNNVGYYGGTDGCLDSNDNGQVYENPCQNLNDYQNWRLVAG